MKKKLRSIPEQIGFIMIKKAKEAIRYITAASDALNYDDSDMYSKLIKRKLESEEEYFRLKVILRKLFDEKSLFF